MSFQQFFWVRASGIIVGLQALGAWDETADRCTTQVKQMLYERMEVLRLKRLDILRQKLQATPSFQGFHPFSAACALLDVVGLGFGIFYLIA